MKKIATFIVFGAFAATVFAQFPAPASAATPEKTASAPAKKVKHEKKEAKVEAKSEKKEVPTTK